MYRGPFLAQGIYRLQYKHPAEALFMVIMLRSYLNVLNYLAGPGHNACSICYIQLAITFTLYFRV